MGRLTKTSVLAAAVCAAIISPPAAAQARPAPTDMAFAATEVLAQKAADRMAAQCQPRFCMDANEYMVGCDESRPESKSTICAYNLYGYFFSGDEAVGDFDCDRPTSNRITGRGEHQRLRARSIGKTRCRDDRQNHATYPWPRVEGPAVQCWPVSCVPAPPPHKTLGGPLKSRGSWFRIS